MVTSRFIPNSASFNKKIYSKKFLLQPEEFIKNAYKLQSKDLFQTMLTLIRDLFQTMHIQSKDLF